jgi:hypothetical protein
MVARNSAVRDSCNFDRPRCHCDTQHDSTGIGWLLVAIFGFAIAALAFSIAVVAAHHWVEAQIGLRLLDRQWLRAGWWTCV